MINTDRQNKHTMAGFQEWIMCCVKWSKTEYYAKVNHDSNFSFALHI